MSEKDSNDRYDSPSEKHKVTGESDGYYLRHEGHDRRGV
jgi:hypothetical protein